MYCEGLNKNFKILTLNLATARLVLSWPLPAVLFPEVWFGYLHTSKLYDIL